MPNEPQYKKCPRCLALAALTAWKPTKGYDPLMREYKCSHCGYCWNEVPRPSATPEPQSERLLPE